MTGWRATPTPEPSAPADRDRDLPAVRDVDADTAPRRGLARVD